MKNVFLIAACREQSAFDILTAKWRWLNKAVPTDVNIPERILRCICLLHNIIIDLERTTHDLCVHQETLYIHASPHASTNVSTDHLVGPQKEQWA
jgi:hypothetical protein